MKQALPCHFHPTGNKDQIMGNASSLSGSEHSVASMPQPDRGALGCLTADMLSCFGSWCIQGGSELNGGVLHHCMSTPGREVV